MGKFFQILFIFILSVKSYAQMDTEHWFAPMGSNFVSANYQALYLSTAETAPFDIEIYSGNNLIGTKTISKGKPEVFTIPRQYIITENPADRMAVLNMGLHLIGTKKYFANLRFSVLNHAEIVTSKGLAGLGEIFYLGMPVVNLGSNPATSNHTASVIATENSTSVTLSGFDPLLNFTNDPSAAITKKVILNKGESYIFEINNDTQSLGKGLIGAKIISDKPISVSNGSFNGRIADTGVDIFMDQSIPVEKTGREFIVMNGNGNLNSASPSLMEQTLIIATDDNTDVFINNNITAIPDYKLSKAGDSLFIKSNQYFPLSPADNIYGLNIKTTKKVYVYQLLAGSSANEKASGGMNIIPALSCFLPSKIDELSDVDSNPVNVSTGQNQTSVVLTHDIKLNIIAQVGADVYVNDSKVGLYGPYPVLGNTDWELYSMFNVKGNITVEAKNGKAITAGIAGGSTNVGYGGYFAGFSSVPSIAKTGDCARGQELVVNDIYDIYEWFFSPDDTIGSYVRYPGTTYSIKPGDKFGYYQCKVTKTNCSPLPLTTIPFKYLKCTDYTAVSPVTIGNCESIPEIVPLFTKDPSVPIDISKTFISQMPAGGRAEVDKLTGKVNFYADNTDLDQVVFKYYFEGSGTFPDSEEVTVTVNISQIKLKNVEEIQCLNFDGAGVYNLKNDFEPVNLDSTYKTYDYYADASLTVKIPNADIEHYLSKPNQTVFVVVTNSYGCNNKNKPAQILLKTYELPVIKTLDVANSNSVTINVAKGRAPYLYYIKKCTDLEYLPALSDYSTSNILPVKDGKGTYTVYVKSADDCNPVTQIFTVIGIPNVITPNDDGKNDSIDMSTLTYKLNPKFQIFTRNSQTVFEGNVNNNFIWNGKQNGTPLPTGTYWYLLQWQDFEGAEPDVMTGWILLKNRN